MMRPDDDDQRAAAGVMAADAAALAGVPMLELSAELRHKLDAVLPPNWSRANPIDIIGDAPVRRYTETLQTLLAESDTGTVLSCTRPPPSFAATTSPVPALPSPVRGGPHDGLLARRCRRRRGPPHLRRGGVAGYETPEQAVRAFAMLATYRRNQALLTEAPSADENGPPDVAGARATIRRALADGRDMLDEFEAKAVLRAYGLPVVPTAVVGPSAAEAVEAARGFGYPAVLKILSPDISHKSTSAACPSDCATSPRSPKPRKACWRGFARSDRRRASPASRCSRWSAAAMRRS
jgi:acetyltransferase